MTDVKHMGVIGNLLINYLNFFIKRGSLRNGHNRKGGGGSGQKRGYWQRNIPVLDIYWSAPPPPMSSRIYIFTKILSRSFIY